MVETNMKITGLYNLSAKSQNLNEFDGINKDGIKRVLTTMDANKNGTLSITEIQAGVNNISTIADAVDLADEGVKHVLTVLDNQLKSMLKIENAPKDIEVDVETLANNLDKEIDRQINFFVQTKRWDSRANRDGTFSYKDDLETVLANGSYRARTTKLRYKYEGIDYENIKIDVSSTRPNIAELLAQGVSLFKSKEESSNMLVSSQPRPAEESKKGIFRFFR